MKSFVLCLSLLSIFGASFAQIPGGKTPITDQSKLTELKETVGTHLKKLDGQANGGNLELIQLHSGTQQIVAGILYDLMAEINENDSPVNCTINLWEKPWMDFVKLGIECGEEKRKYLYTSHPEERRKRQLGSFGGFQEMSADGLNKLQPKLTSTFEQLSSQFDDFDVKLLRIRGGKFQVVAGTHYIVQVDAHHKDDASDIKHCEVDILENLKSEFDQVDVKCDHKTKLFRYSKGETVFSA